MELSRRGFFAASTAAALVAPVLAVDPPAKLPVAPAAPAARPAAAAAPATPAATATPAPVARPGQLTEDSLGKLLQAMGLKPTKVDKRYDFTFRSVQNKEEWDLSMTAVLSADGQSVWIMAWLDELPKSADAVPRSALLRLLGANDQLGSGKFFAYVASNRRFVLQRVIANENMSTKGVAEALKDLGTSVVQSHPFWSTASWGGTAAPATVATTESDDDDDDDSQPVATGAVTRPGTVPAPAAPRTLPAPGQVPVRTATGTPATTTK